jgi:hypothetical protein
MFVGVLWEWQLELDPGDVEVIPWAALLEFGPPDLSASEGQVTFPTASVWPPVLKDCTIICTSNIAEPMPCAWPKGVAEAEVDAPEGSTLHVLLAGELVAGWGFPRRQLYVEYRILYDPEIWRLLPRGRFGFKDTTHPRPGVIRVHDYVLQVNVCTLLVWHCRTHFRRTNAYSAH